MERTFHHNLSFSANCETPLGEYAKCCIPCRVHGDAVPYGKSKKASADCIDWCSMLAMGDVLDVINLWTVVPAKYIAKDPFVFTPGSGIHIYFML